MVVGAVFSLKLPPMEADGEIIPFWAVHRGKDLICVGDVDDLPALGLLWVHNLKEAIKE